MQRYFSDSLKDNKPVLSLNDIHHFKNVVRLKNNEIFEIVYNKTIYTCKVNYSDNDFFIIESCRYIVLKDYELTFLLASSKSNKMELVLQKCSEIGIDDFIIYNSKFSIVKVDANYIKNKQDRYNKIIKSACEQSKNDNIPTLTFLNELNNLNLHNYDLKLVCYEEASLTSISLINDVLKAKKILAIIGPEGGFSKEEIKECESKGFLTISLGKNILRCETAPIYLASVINFLKENKNVSK